MRYTLRDYQQAASDAAVRFFNNKSIRHNGLMVLPTGSGKSLIIADIAHRLEADILVFCPSKEILEQNYEKALSYGIECSAWSASMNSKVISRVTFCTVGSVKNQAELFKHFRYVMIDEAHLVSPKKGMYKSFLSQLKCKVIGLTATPYRLESTCRINPVTKKPMLETAKSMLRMLTSYPRPLFREIIYSIQIEELLKRGYLANVRYFDVQPEGWRHVRLFKNTSGAEFTDKSISAAFNKTDFHKHLVQVVRRLLDNRKTGIHRNGILVFTRFVEEAVELSEQIDGCVVVSGDTPLKEREEILQRFKNGEIKVVVNAQTLTTGFDYPALDTVVMARPTMSLSLYYQIIGRCIRPSSSKQDSWFIDLCGNIERFGSVDDLKLDRSVDGTWNVFSNGKQLTNIIM